MFSEPSLRMMPPLSVFEADDKTTVPGPDFTKVVPPVKCRGARSQPRSWPRVRVSEFGPLMERMRVAGWECPLPETVMPG